MPTLLNLNEHEPKHIHIIKGKKVSFNSDFLIVELEDGRIINTPMSWYKELSEAKFSDLKNYHFICDNTGIEWDNLDYHLSIISMLKN